MSQVLTFSRPAPIRRPQLSDEIMSGVGVWLARWVHAPPNLEGAVAPRDSPLTPAQIAQIQTIVTNHTPDPSFGLSDEELFSVERLLNVERLPVVWATLTGANIPARTATVERTILGKTIQLTAGVCYALVRAFQDGQLAPGDKVLVAFVDGDPSKPVAFDKLVL